MRISEKKNLFINFLLLRLLIMTTMKMMKIYIFIDKRSKKKMMRFKSLKSLSIRENDRHDIRKFELILRIKIFY